MTVHAVDSTTYPGMTETIKLASSAALQRETNFNSDWKFYLGTSSTAQNQNFDDSSWKDISLPHDFSISQSFTTSGEAESGFLPGGTGWYRKSFTLPASAADQTLVLNFDGVYKDATVYVNGAQVGKHHYGYTSFAFDISDYVTCDGATENVVAVKVVNNIPSSRWYSGSGIYRDVTLIATDPVHVEYNGIAVTTPNIASGTGTVNVAVELKNDSTASAAATVTSTVYTKGGTSALAVKSTTATVSAGSTTTATVAPVVSSPNLWSIDSPNLYTVRTEISVDGTVVDTVETDFGFRYFSFDATGFHLNGENVKLNGVCLHHDQGALGSAAYYDAMYRQLSMMKEMGVNAIRTAHNPADEDFIDICNEMGLLVIEEAFDGLDEAKNGNSYDFSQNFTASADTSLVGASRGMTCAEYAARSMVRRDRNAPSIIAWSFGNEIQEGTYWTTVNKFPTYAANFISWVQEEDVSRPITSGDNNRGGDSRLKSVINNIINSGGVAGFNYANDTSTLYNLAQDFGGVIIASETSSSINSRGVYNTQTDGGGGTSGNSVNPYNLTSYDTSSVSWGITSHDSIYNTYQYDCVAGEFIWTGFDYIGEPTPWNKVSSGSVTGAEAIPNSSYFGAVDTAGFEKDSYYLYRSQWKQDDTTLHLVTAWDNGNMMTTNSKTPVWVYSNAPVVKLYRDGTHIGTATRETHTSSAGHTYYSYTTGSEDSSVCTTSSGSGADGLYSVFNVTYSAGTISAKAFQSNGTTEITNTAGTSSVTTPGTVSKLQVERSDSTIEADGSSLVYIEVEVQDENGNLDTTATNNISFTLSGNGEIIGVDNGDQATTAKYQQSSVLTSSTSANIDAYAGKALAIVRSTDEAGSFTVNVSSTGLTGDSASVTTTEVKSDSAAEGLASYTMVRDYSVMQGVAPSLQTTATGSLADGSTTTGTIVWGTVSSTTYSTLGNHTINGTLTFSGYDPIAVSCSLHVIPDVIAMRNISTVTSVSTVPTLPNVVNGVLADGTVMTGAQNGEFTVQWESMRASDFVKVGDIVVVNGTATVIGSTTLPVTASIRVAEKVNTESANTAHTAASLTEDCTYISDNLNTLIDGSTSYNDDTSYRWTNYNNRTTSSTATITFRWDTAQAISSANLYFFVDSGAAQLPSAVKFEYSLGSTTFTEIGYADVTPSGGFIKTEYVFDEVINPVSLRITLTQQSGKCVGLTEVEIMSYAGALECNSSSDLSGISVDGTAVDNFSASTLSYTAVGTTNSVVTATTGVNAGITVLPIYNGVIRVLTISEDGSSAKTYEITFSSVSACEHINTELRNVLSSTCTAAGYTGDTYCTDCNTKISSGTSIAATGHTNTETVNVRAATCTAAGYTGDTYCFDCNSTIATGTTIAATGHNYEQTSTNGSMVTYTCSDCDDTYTVNTAADSLKVIVSASQTTGGRIKITGLFEAFLNEDSLGVVAHGLLYRRTDRLNGELTASTAGRTRVNFSNYETGGMFNYTLFPTTASTEYTVRAFLVCSDGDGGYAYIYSDEIEVSYNSIN